MKSQIFISISAIFIQMDEVIILIWQDYVNLFHMII